MQGVTSAGQVFFINSTIYTLFHKNTTLKSIQKFKNVIKTVKTTSSQAMVGDINSKIFKKNSSQSILCGHGFSCQKL